MTTQEQNNDESWAEKLTPEQFNICRLKGTEPPLLGNMRTVKKSVFIIVFAVIVLYLIHKLNMIQAQVGRVFGQNCQKAVSQNMLTTVMVSVELKSLVKSVTRI